LNPTSRVEQTFDALDHQRGAVSVFESQLQSPALIYEINIGRMADVIAESRIRFLDLIRRAVLLDHRVKLLFPAGQRDGVGGEIFDILLQYLCGIALRIDTDEDGQGFLPVGAELFEDAVDAAQNHRASFSAGGVAEEEQDHFPAVIGQAELLAVVIGEGEVTARSRLLSRSRSPQCTNQQQREQ
jgi:hypothetical protein